MTARARLAILVTAGALATAIAAIAADPRPSPVDDPVGKWDDYEMIIQVDVPLRGTLRRVYVDGVSAAEARRTGELPYGTKIVMQNYLGVADGQGGWKSDSRPGSQVGGTPQPRSDFTTSPAFMISNRFSAGD